MGSSASAAALLVLPFPSPSSSDDSDDGKILPPSPVLEPGQQQQLVRRWLDLERDCNMAMKALSRAGDVEQVVDLFYELMLSASTAGVVPSVLCYNTLLNALVEDGRAADTRKVFDEMLAAGVAPNTSSFNILVKLYAWQTLEFHLAYDEIHGMRGHGVVPDTGTYSTLVTGLCRVGRLAEAWGVLDWMLQEGCLPMVHTFDEVDQVLGVLKTKGLKPSAVTYNTYMDALSKKGMAEKALQLVENMGHEGLKPTSFTLSIVLNCFCFNSKYSEVIPLLERSTELNWCAAVVAYNTVMSRLCDTGRWSAILELWADMTKKGIIPNTRTFNILIHSLCIRGKLSVVKNLVFNHGLPANVVTYNTLIHWSYYHGKASDVDNVFEYMTKVADITPDEVTYTIMVDGLCRQGKFDEATDCFKESLKNRLLKDPLTALINRLGHNERIGNILAIFEEIERQGFVRCHMIFDDTIRSFCRFGFRQHTKMFNLEFLLDGILGPGKEVYPACKVRGKR
ncbi:Pentatricopeptide repeat-containing protein [Dichanthelium oligosanthes]|uniref:Pentatricopeptide repeat-containing protein n=1 Tax=Dichanthelium oligosanthes TaxID=888268 RepID=A0A1E5VME0_9POAL|nr:Pentatricopeptide repeat-containing protein [Dichanthelium oligosanthes]